MADDHPVNGASRPPPAPGGAPGLGAPDRDPRPVVEEEAQRPAKDPAKNEAPKAMVSWSDLPRKEQLLVITLTRLSEPLVQTSLQSYLFYQLKWFDPSLPDSVIATQSGIMHASFTAAQFLTAMMWGYIADSSYFGRKKVLLIGLAGTMFSCIGFAFSTTFWQALFFRSVGGITNGNVGVLRTMISETVEEKKYQPRAFLLLPMTFNIGVIIGPMLGGMLSDLAGSYPDVFGNVKFFRDFPYAAPNLVSAVFLCLSATAVWTALEETLESRRDKRDIGLEFGAKVAATFRRIFSRRGGGSKYSPLPTRDPDEDDQIADANTPLLANGDRRAVDQPPPASPPPSVTQKRKPARRRYTQRLPFRRIFTRNVTLTLAANSLLGCSVGSFNSLWFVFLSTPVYNPADIAHRPRAPFYFTGGLGFHPREVGSAMGVLGILGACLQLFLYPRLSARLGTARSWRLALLCFPLAYFLVPYLSLVPSSPDHPPPGGKAGPGVWTAVSIVLFIQVVGRTFALPAQAIMVNNCSPHPSVLGSVHGIAQSASSLARTIGPVLFGVLYGYGLDNGVVGAAWWALSGVAICALLGSLWVREGDGHEIWLEGDEDD